MLSPSQREAVLHTKGPCLTLAGPGAGKTTVLLERLCRLISEENVEPEKILVITFTKAAALEMKERFESLVTGSAPVVFGTFHSVFFHMLRKEKQYRNYQLLLGREKTGIVKEAVHQAKVHMEEHELQQLQLEISYIKNAMLLPQEYQELSWFGDDFVKLFDHYEARKRAYARMDFDDILVYMYETLKKDENFRTKWQKQFSYIFVDEIQDVNPLQFFSIQYLAEPENNLFVVGDDDQAIYGFRGAKAKWMLQFLEYYPKGKICCLQDNFRCPKDIVEQSLTLISHNKDRYEKQIICRTKQKGILQVMEFETPEEEAQGVAELIKAEGQQRPYTQIAVLFRNHNQCLSLVERCKENHIPVMLRDSIQNPYQGTVVLDVIAYLKMGRKLLHRRDLFRIMNKPNRFLARDSVEREWVTFDSWKGFYKEQLWLYERIEQLQRQSSFMKKLSPKGAISYVLKVMGYEKYMIEHAKSQQELLNYREQIGLLEQLADQEKTVEQLLTKWEEASKNFYMLQEQGQQKKEEGVQFLTLHSSKGLEFPVVYIIGCNAGKIPSKKAETVEQIEEERRLFYVGITRAKEKLFLSYGKEYMGEKMSPSPFLKEMREADV